MQFVARQRRNPFGMSPPCERFVPGCGDTGADFHVVGDHPGVHGGADTGVPFTGDEAGERFQHILGSVGLNNSLPSSEDPELDNAYLAYLTRCRHPDRGPTEAEVVTCEPYLNADVRMINPEILVPVGQRALTELAREHTTKDADEMDVAARHATTIRGRGFELAPMVHPADQTDEQTEAYIEFFLDLKGTDYRQTKGRRER